MSCLNLALCRTDKEQYVYGILCMEGLSMGPVYGQGTLNKVAESQNFAQDTILMLKRILRCLDDPFPSKRKAKLLCIM